MEEAGWHKTTGRKPVMLSFWFRASKAGTFGGRIHDDAFTASYIFSFNVTAVDTWQKIEMAIPAPSTGTWMNTNAATLALDITTVCGSAYQTATPNIWGSFAMGATGATSLTTAGDALYITGIQMYPLDDASNPVVRPYMHKSYAEELRECHRYYEKIYAAQNASRYCTGFAQTDSIVTFVLQHGSKRSSAWSFSYTGQFQVYGVTAHTITSMSISTRTKAGELDSTYFYANVPSLTVGDSFHLRGDIGTKIVINDRL